MSLACNAKGIIHDIHYWDISITKENAIRKMCDKQIPKAIKYDRNGQNECPICESHVYTDDNYCFHCGQRLFTDLNNA